VCLTRKLQWLLFQEGHTKRLQFAAAQLGEVNFILALALSIKKPMPDS